MNAARILSLGTFLIFFTLPFSAHAALTDNLVSYWKLDESSGNAIDSAGNNTLSNNGTATYTTAKINNGVVLDGSSQYLSHADNASLSITGDLTVSLWVKFTSITYAQHTMVAKFKGSGDQRSWMIRTEGANLYFLSSSNGTDAGDIQSSVSWTPATSTWYHIVVVYTSGSGAVDFYVNGSQQGTQQSGNNTSIFDSTADFSVGARSDVGAMEFVDGTIDEIGLWNRALSSAEVTSLYNGGTGWQYPFNANVGSANRLAKFITPNTTGDSLFYDDGSNMTLTSGNLFMQIGSLIDTVTGGALNFGTTNATSINIGRAGITTTFMGPLAANGLATFGNNITVPAAFGLDTSSAGVLNIGTTTATTINIGGTQAITKVLGLFQVPAAYGIDTATAGSLNIGTTTATSITIGKTNATTTFPGTVAWGKETTTANCNSSASPATCGTAPAGSVAMATGGSTLVVNTTAVTANSQIFVIDDSSLGTRLGITCNTTTGRVYSINARTAGTSFTIKSSANPATNKACLSYWIIN